MCPSCGEPYEIKNILSAHTQRLGLLSEAFAVMLDSQAFILSALGKTDSAISQKHATDLASLSGRLRKSESPIAPKLHDTRTINVGTVVAKPIMAAVGSKPATQKIIVEQPVPAKPVPKPEFKSPPPQAASLPKAPAPKPIEILGTAHSDDDDIAIFEIKSAPPVPQKRAPQPAPAMASKSAQKVEEVDLFDL